MYNYIFLALVTAFCWGLQTVLYKHLLEKFNGITIMLFTSFVFLIYVIILAAINKKIIQSDMNKFTNNDLSILLGLSPFIIFITNVIYHYVLKDHNSSIIAALIYSSPVFTLIISYLYLNERLNKNGLFGIISIMIGIIFISQNNKIS